VTPFTYARGILLLELHLKIQVTSLPTLMKQMIASMKKSYAPRMASTVRSTQILTGRISFYLRGVAVTTDAHIIAVFSYLFAGRQSMVFIV